MAPIEAEYEARRSKALTAFTRLTTTRRRLTSAFFLLLFLTGFLFWHHIWWPAGALAALAAAFFLLMARERHHSLRESRRIDFYERALKRASGEVSQTGHTGEAFAEEGHLYARDLDVLGPNSLFGMLATTRTAIGQRALARMLLHSAEPDQVCERRLAVQELSAQLDLREGVGLIGRVRLEDVPAEDFENWLNIPHSHFPRWPSFVLPVITLSWIALLIVGMVKSWDAGLVWRNVLLLLLVQALLCWRHRPKVVVELESVKRLATQTEILHAGVRIMREASFQSGLLRKLQQAVEGEDRALARLQQYLILVEQRSIDWLFVIFLFTCGGTHLALRLDAWKQRYDASMRRWLEAWAEFEALMAIATYAAEHPENAFPEILDNKSTPGPTATFIAQGLKHPLLEPDAIANDVTLDAETQFLLISGSNMAGKSTLLRAIGANTILAWAGAPVPARAMRLGVSQLGASITISDSLAEGKSKFLAEVERLRSLVHLAKENPGQTLFLIDEVLSGTNSLDRRAAAESILRSLVEAGGIGALSTHDLTLTAIAEMSDLHGSNVHMASADENDPLGFDYLLKPGVNRTTNALAIVRMLGLTRD